MIKRKGGFKPRREKPEFDQKIVDIRRVARVVKGGRRFSFRVSVVIGNRKGVVGVGLGKASDTAKAIEKAFKSAKKNRIKINLTPEGSIPYELSAKFTCAKVMIKPARGGRGLVAGSSLRTVLDLAGISDVTGKVISRSKNKLNIARAAIKALKAIEAKGIKMKLNEKENNDTSNKKPTKEKNFSKKLGSDKK